MKVSLNWLKQFTRIELSAEELVQKIGAQLGAVEEVVNIGDKYRGVVIAKVVACDKHPNADKLSVCKIDDGGMVADMERDENGLVQVVCGAPNVREGILVAWLPPGSTVPSSYDKEPFVLGARELRGIVSNGMLASAAELAIGDNHAGILEVDIETEPGTSFAELYELNDTIIDIENKMFTHRPDCFGILGVAREIAGIQGIEFKSPDWYLQILNRVQPGETRLPLTVRNEIQKLCPRFMAVTMADVSIKPSPVIIQTYLSRVGLRPINNIVDVTNYLMVLTGQPLHAYDYDKVLAQDVGAETATLVVRKPNSGEKITLLNGKTIEPRDEAILITTETQPIGLGGVMGGADTEVDENTKNIILECANFDMYSIRRTSMAHGLFTDAVTRFNKGQSPRQNDVIMEEAIATLQYVSGAQVASEIIDAYDDTSSYITSVHVNKNFINARLGLNFGVEEIAKLLRNVEFSVDVHNDELTIAPPFWRTDIELPEDIVEEVGRLEGFDTLPQILPQRDLSPAIPNELLQFKGRLRELLTRMGANELLTYSFVHGNTLDKAGQDKEQAYRLSNALSPDLQYYRMSLIPSLLDKVHGNIKAGYDQFAIFELNKSHNKNDIDENDADLPKEHNTLALVYAAEDKAVDKHAGAAYYVARKYLDELLVGLGIDVTFEAFEQEPAYPAGKPFDMNRSALIRHGESGKIIGAVGEFKPSIVKSFKLPQHSAGFEVSTTLLLQTIRPKAYRTLSRYPRVQQDLSLRLSRETPYQEVQNQIAVELQKLQDEQLSTEIIPLDIYAKKNIKHVTFRINFTHANRTLTATEVNVMLNTIASELKNTLNAERL